MKTFTLSYLCTIIGLALAFWWKGISGVLIISLLIAMEISFSFDNAVVNATVLKRMNAKWQQRFLTWGMLIAVFGMYYLFPILIVAVATGLGVIEVTQMAVDAPATYSHHLESAHVQIASFGGMFLLMVFLKFFVDEHKELHWLKSVERRLASLGKLEAVEIVLALGLLLIIQLFLPEADRLHEMVAGAFGVMLYVAVSSLTSLMAGDGAGEAMGGYSGLMAFLYLQVLDASFSLDAVIGSFAISRDIVIIILGLTVGAMFVRSLTVHLVRKGTLDDYIFLEHGAHYGIGALALIMLIGIVHPVPEVITGLIGLAFIALSFVSSILYRRRQKA